MKRRSLWAVFVSWFLCAVCVVPFFYVLVTAAIREGQVSLLSYYRVFLGQTEFLLRFWKSLGLSLCIAGAQVAVSTLAGYGFACVILLSFVDAWNMVEQPLSYLEEFSQYPIAVALAAVSPAEPTVLLACCVLVTLPPLFFFLVFGRELSGGISVGGEK